MVLAIVSHLPHIIAYNIVGTADDLEAVTQVGSDQILGLAAFAISPALPPPTRPCGATSACTTRTRSSKCWRASRKTSPSLQRAIRWGDGDKLFDLFTRTRAVRRSIIEAGQEIDAPDFGRQAIEHPKA